MSDTWQNIPIPAFCERLLGFSVPQKDELIAVSYEGVHLLRLGSSVTVETFDQAVAIDLSLKATGVFRFADKDWHLLGLHPGRPLLSNPQGERLELDEQGSTLSIYRGEEKVWSIRFENFSGDWVRATFSPDGRYIVLGCPYDFDFRVWRRED